MCSHSSATICWRVTGEAKRSKLCDQMLEETVSGNTTITRRLFGSVTVRAMIIADEQVDTQVGGCRPVIVVSADPSAN